MVERTEKLFADGIIVVPVLASEAPEWPTEYADPDLTPPLKPISPKLTNSHLCANYDQAALPPILVAA